ncbi:MAG: TonB family protein [Candidatus Hydrothermales bacterium]
MKVSTSKAYGYIYKTPKYSNYTGFTVSLIVHALILLLLLLRQSVYSEGTSLSVTLLEEEIKKRKIEEKRETVKKEEEKKPGPEVRHKPNLFAAIQRTIEPPPPITNINIKQKIDVPKIEISKNLPIEPAPIVPLKDIEIKSVTEDIGPQAKIDIKSLKIEESGIGSDIVVGQGAPTSEILKRPAYKPTVDISKQVAESGLGQGGIAQWGPGGGSGTVGSKKVELKVKMEEPPPSSPLPSPSTSFKPEIRKKEKKIEVEISGSIAGRKIIAKFLPSYPSWAAERGVEAAITVKVEVEPDGTVRKNVLVIGTSGYPNWDNIVKNSVLSWKFESLPSDIKTIQSGYITFRFILE